MIIKMWKKIIIIFGTIMFKLTFGGVISLKNSNTTTPLLWKYVERSKYLITCSFLRANKCDEIKNGSECLDDLQGVIKYNNLGCIDAVLSCNCATFDKKINAVTVGKCVQNCKSIKQNYIGENTYTNLSSNVLEWNDILCGPFNRSGILCGRCQEGLHTKAYSFDLSCVKCSNIFFNWWKYIMIAFVPVTFFCLFILATNAIVPSTLLQGFPLYCQIISSPLFLRIALVSVKDYWLPYHSIKFLSIIYGIWNLDFFRAYDLNICLRMGTLSTLSLDLVIAFYPLALIIIIYICVQLHQANFKPLVIAWKPFKTIFSKFNKEFKIHGSCTNAFGTFMLLSSVKLLNVCFDILIGVEVVEIYSPTNSSTSLRLYYDASIKYFSRQHLPYVIFAITILFTNILLPTLLLFFYPFTMFQRFLNKFPRRLQIVLRTFIDSFQGCYQDGVHSGSVDYRCLSALPFIIRLFVYVLYSTLLNISFTILAAMCCVIHCLIFLSLQPFQVQKYNSHTMIISLFLGICCVCATFFDLIGANKIEFSIYHTLTIILNVFPTLYFFFHLCTNIFLRVYHNIKRQSH